MSNIILLEVREMEMKELELLERTFKYLKRHNDAEALKLRSEIYRVLRQYDAWRKNKQFMEMKR